MSAERPYLPPPLWVVRRLRGLGVPDAELRGLDGRDAFTRLADLEDQRAAQRLPPGDDDPALDGPDGWPPVFRREIAVAVAGAAGCKTREKLESLIEHCLSACTRRELERAAAGFARMLAQDLSGRATTTEGVAGGQGEAVGRPAA